MRGRKGRTETEEEEGKEREKARGKERENEGRNDGSSKTSNLLVYVICIRSLLTVNIMGTKELMDMTFYILCIPNIHIYTTEHTHALRCCSGPVSWDSVCIAFTCPCHVSFYQVVAHITTVSGYTAFESGRNIHAAIYWVV